MQLNIIHFIQGFASPLLDKIMVGITQLGEVAVAAAVMLVVYYCVDKKFGRFLIYTVLTSHIFNSGLKTMLNHPRPIGYEGVRTLRANTAGGSSFPSGHTQNATGVLYALYRYTRKKLWLVLTFVIGIFVALSRLYLGVHWPMDVLGGFIAAIVVGEICWRLFKVSKNHPLLFLLTLGVLALMFSQYLGNDRVARALGMLGGLSAGCWFEETCVKMRDNLSIIRRVIRLLLAGLLTALVYVLLGFVVPAGAIGLAITGFVLVFTVTGFAPLILKQFGL